MPVLEMKNVRKSFGDLEVLKDISLSVREGEVVSVLGPSGSGKSTLLRCATQLETMTSGELSYMGETEPKEMMKHYGMVFQNFNLFPHYSVLKNIIDAPVSTQKRDKNEVLSLARSLLKKLGLEGKEDSYPCQLSGGQKQRVAIARALAMQPKLLFFDEPTSALDPELTAEILKVLLELAKEKMTMVIVTHEIDFARHVSDRVIFIDGGVIVEEGKPEDVIDHPSNERTQNFLKKLQRG
ncbi:MAG: amino acid ABC transporter ATP-binding protein [Lachnospiraceae bacterium]|nr:amino acid ABC transporter ATP-binding protein [Lachnospiraceae bacterium]